MIYRAVIKSSHGPSVFRSINGKNCKINWFQKIWTTYHINPFCLSNLCIFSATVKQSPHNKIREIISEQAFPFQCTCFVLNYFFNLAWIFHKYLVKTHLHKNKKVKRLATLSNFAIGTISGMSFAQAQVHTNHSTSAECIL